MKFMQIANVAKKLEAVGLTEKQAKVYVAALFLGPAAVQRIAEQAEVNRATTYVILAELADMGLVSESTEGKKTVYVAEPPEAIDRYLNAMEKAIDDRKAQLKGVMTELKEASRIEVEDAPVVRFFKGPEAAEATIQYLRRKSKKHAVVYSVTDMNEVLRLFPDILEKGPARRMKKAIESRVIYSGDVEVKDDPSSGRKTKKMQTPAIADINIYEDRMAIVTYDSQDTTGVIIESKAVVSAFRQLFELAWESKNL